GDGVVGASSMARQSLRSRECGEEDDRVAAELDVVREHRPLLGGEPRRRRVETQGVELAEIDRELLERVARAPLGGWPGRRARAGTEWRRKDVSNELNRSRYCSR